MTVTILKGDCRDVLLDLPADSVHCVVTSPPYWGLRDYGIEGQLGLEDSAADYVAGMVAVFDAIRRPLRDDGTIWLNLGDSYAGGGNYRGIRSENTLTAKQRSNRGATGVSQKLSALGKDAGAKAKDLVGIPWLTAFALREAGWYLRQDIIWAKPNPMPESIRDRCTKAHEYIFLLSKSSRYYYDADAIAEPLAETSVERLGQNIAEQRGSNRVPGKTNGPMKAVGRATDTYTARAYEHPQSAPRGPASNFGIFDKRNKRSVWEVTTQGFSEAHFATFPPALIEPCILAGCPEGGTVLDPFGGAGTTGMVADRLRRNAILIEINPEYAALAERRIRGDAPLFANVTDELS